jgi:hypothetical protein
MQDISLILDIGNGSIGASLVSYEKSRAVQTEKTMKGNFGYAAKPTILYTHREPITFMPLVTSQRLLEAMLGLLEAVLKHVQKEGFGTIHRNLFGKVTLAHVVCVFSSPWYISQTASLKTESEKPIKVTNALVNELITKEEVRFNTTLEGGNYKKYFGSEVVLLERNLVHTAINGYEIGNPVGKNARLLELTLFTSLISETVLRQVESVFYKVFHVRMIECFSYALASWNAVRTLFPAAEDFLFLDVSGETTDASVTIRGAITETISFPFGRATILRSIVKALDVTPETALSLVKMRTAGNLEKKVADGLEKALADISNEWITEFNQTLSDISKKYNLPKKAFVTIDPDFAELYGGILHRADIGPGLFKGPFDITLITKDILEMFIQTAGKTDSTIDPALALEAVFFANKIR